VTKFCIHQNRKAGCQNLYKVGTKKWKKLQEEIKLKGEDDNEKNI